MNFIQHPVILQGRRVKLVPLEEKHFDALKTIGAASEIWTHLAIDGSKNDTTLLTALQSAVLKRMTGEEYPFVIIDSEQDTIIGSTRFMNIYPEHKKLEIGWTWYAPAYWGTGHNTECKLLLLTYCFEQLKTMRVQFMTREENLRSRAAIQKIGAKFEGILRKERMRYDGPRNTAVYSIIDDEWEAVKTMLINKTVNNDAV